MDQKAVKYHDLVFELAQSDYRKRPGAVEEVFARLLKLDANLYISLWEYLLLREEQLLDTPAYNDVLSSKLFLKLHRSGAQRAFKAVTEPGEIQRVIFSRSAAPLEDELLSYMVGLIYTGKFDRAQPLLRLLQKNTVVPYGEYFIKLFDAFYAHNLANLKDAKIVTLKKSAARFLLEMVSKIRGDERALLTQRINELLHSRIEEE